MKVIHGIELKPGSREELLPGYSAEFPYIASFVELDKYAGRQAPWHWHKDVELFLITQGEVEYYTTGGKKIFCAGMGGFVNANALHMTKTGAGSQRVTSLLHLFDPLLISGQKGSAIDQKYVLPLTTASRIEIMGLIRTIPGMSPFWRRFGNPLKSRKTASLMSFVCVPPFRICGSAFWKSRSSRNRETEEAPASAIKLK